MTKPEPAEAPAPSIVAELARNHSAECLHCALVARLRAEGPRADGMDPLAEALFWQWQEWGDGGLDLWLVAGVLIARLRAEGSGALADALSSLITKAGVPPIFFVPESVEKYPEGTSGLRYILCQRLELDGHHELAATLTALVVKHAPSMPDAAPSMPDAVPGGATVAPGTGPVDHFHWPTQAERAAASSLMAAHDARTLREAFYARLHDDGRDGWLGNLMVVWLMSTVGPIVDPRELADALIERLRAPTPDPAPHWLDAPNPDLADAIELLLEDARIDRDADDILRVWQAAVLGPMVETRPIAARLVEALRIHERVALVHNQKHAGRLPPQPEHPGLADAVLALFQGADPPLIDRKPLALKEGS